MAENKFTKRDGVWTREDRKGLYIVNVRGVTRVPVWALSSAFAYDVFVDEHFPLRSGGGRIKPPALGECVIRPADDDEMAQIFKRNKRKLRVADVEPMFDPTPYDKNRRHESGDVTINRPPANIPSDPVLDARLRAIANVPERRFDGSTYEPEHDSPRLTGQLGKVAVFMDDHAWHTLDQIQFAVGGGSQAAISARLRDLRKAKFGSHIVLRRRHPDAPARSGLFQYRVPARDEVLDATPWDGTDEH